MDKEDVVHTHTHTHTHTYTHTHNGTLLIKKNEILPFATTWMDLEGIMLLGCYRRREGVGGKK